MCAGCRQGAGREEPGREILRFSAHEPNVLPALRERHSRVLGKLKDEGYLGNLDYWAPMTSIGATLDSLAIQRGLDFLDADVEVGEDF